MVVRQGTFILFFILGVFFSPGSRAQDLGLDLGPVRSVTTVSQVKVEGLKRVEKEAVLERAQIKEGQSLTQYQLRSAVKKLYASQFFEKVSLVRQGTVLVIKVQERPLVRKIQYLGNKKISDKEIGENAILKEANIFKKEDAQSDREMITQMYKEKGYFVAQVDIEEKPLAETGEIEVIFHVREYQKTKVKKITFLGNKALSDEELKGFLLTKEEGFFSFLRSSGKFNEEMFAVDVNRLNLYYKNKGFLYSQIDPPQVTITPDRRWIFITFVIDEGDVFDIDEISFSGDLLREEEELQDLLEIEEGERYSEEKVLQTIQKLTLLYQDEGYAFANVNRGLKPNIAEKKVSIDFSFEKGELAQIGTITILGNNKTRDKVIRREMRVYEGELFSGTGLKKSQANINRLGFFEPGSVAIEKVPRLDGKTIDLEVRVKERSTNQISVGAGYSSATKAFFTGTIAQNNFRGLGQNLRFNATLSGINQTYNISFTEPYLFDSRWSGGFDVFRIRSEASNAFAYVRAGFSLRSGYWLFDNTRLTFNYTLEDLELKEVVDPNIDENLENGIISSLQTTLTYDVRNNRFQPTDGFFLTSSLQFAGIGGDQKWLRADFETRFYQPLWKNFVFKTRLSARQIIKTSERGIPRSQKFALGGPRNLRGFDIEDIGPIETRADINGVLTDFNVRGRSSIFANFEIESPLVKEANLYWAVFFDAGNVYRDYVGKGGDFDLRFNYGFGVRWFSPMGVLRFEFGYPVNRKAREKSGQFHFDIGHLF